MIFRIFTAAQWGATPQKPPFYKVQRGQKFFFECDRGRFPESGYILILGWSTARSSARGVSVQFFVNFDHFSLKYCTVDQTRPLGQKMYTGTDSLIHYESKECLILKIGWHNSCGVNFEVASLPQFFKNTKYSRTNDGSMIHEKFL